MKNANSISQLMLERYHRGKVSLKERELVEAALVSDAEFCERYEELKKSDEELLLLYPLERLSRLAVIKDNVVPISITGLSSPGNRERSPARKRLFTGINQRWSGVKKIKWGFGITAILLCVLFPVFTYLKLNNYRRMAEKIYSEADSDRYSMRAPLSGQTGKEEFFPGTMQPQTSGSPYDDSLTSDSVTRSSTATRWEGTGFNPEGNLDPNGSRLRVPEGPAGIEGQAPPAYRDMSNLYGRIIQNAEDPLVRESENFNTSEFDHISDNPFRRVTESPLSTFSIDVDTAGYSITRYFLTNGQRPPRSAVRIEELINYFDYAYPPPIDGKPFALHVETGAAPWNPGHLLARIAIKGREFSGSIRPRVNLVFLLDVSGSMDEPNRLPLVVSSMKMLVNELKGNDKVAICIYAGAAGTVLPPTSGDDKNKILAALDKLKAGGSTAGGAGIQLAYRLAEQNFDPGAVNRVILCTDGDFNVGVSSRSELVGLITGKARSGIYLTVLGFGMDNYRDGTLKQLASKGNGNYGYIDTLEEAGKILVEQLSSTLITIAQDVKIQVEFNPATVGAYRLIGYENRLLRKEDFNDDTIDAGDIGAGHTVTAFYELIPPGLENDALPQVDTLKYGSLTALETVQTGYPDELLTVKLRYKLPQETESSLLSLPVTVSSVRKTGEESLDFRFAAAVAGFGMMLRDSPYKGNTGYENIFSMAQAAIGQDASGYRRGFLELVKKAQTIKN